MRKRKRIRNKNLILTPESSYARSPSHLPYSPSLPKKWGRRREETSTDWLK
jgi:hypothetical protein